MEINSHNNNFKILGYFDFTTTFFKENDPYASVSIIQEDDGIKIKFSFFEEQTKRHTVLIVNPVPRSDLGIENQNTYNCRYISYDSSDKTLGSVNDISLNTYTKNIVVDIDPYLILHNEQYFNVLMNKILRLERVERYLNNNAEIPCGNYVGGLYYDNHGGFEKRVNPSIAKVICTLYREQLITEKHDDEIRKLIAERNKFEKKIIIAKNGISYSMHRIGQIDNKLEELGYNAPYYEPEQNLSSPKR